MVSNGHVRLDGIVFDKFRFFPFSVTVGFVRAKAYFQPHISYDVMIREVVKGGAFEFIGRGHTKNWIMLCKSHQY